VIQHAGLIALRHAGLWRGVLLLGPSGAGKSDLALRCLDLGFVLIADDRVETWTSGGGLFGAPPEILAGLVEARGLGLVTLGYRPWVRIALAVDCVASGEAARMPEPQVFEVLGLAIPRLRLACLEASAPAKLRHALIGLGTSDQRA
jgi:serine kinase of HPr protein (carbohydrate metabolism regulator)